MCKQKLVHFTLLFSSPFNLPSSLVFPSFAGEFSGGHLQHYKPSPSKQQRKHTGLFKRLVNKPWKECILDTYAVVLWVGLEQLAKTDIHKPLN